MVTSLVNILNRQSKPICCRALLDTASTSNLITESMANYLNIPRKRYTLSISGLGNIQTSTTSCLITTIQSRHTIFERQLEFFVVSEITNKHPSSFIDKKSIAIPSNVSLADPTFNIPGKIDVLIGSGTTLSIILPGQHNITRSGDPDLFMQNSRLGWIVGGAVVSSNSVVHKTLDNKTSFCHLTTTQAVQQLTKTWAVDDGPKVKYLSPEECACEDHFYRHTTRDIDGRYIVALPFNEKQFLLGESKERALKRLKTLENKFKRNSEFQREYTATIQEYLNLGHMEIVLNDINGSEGFYLPHHAVFKEASQTTKLRVVFDGSAKSSTGISLNETLMVGPTIQDTLFTHIIKFRLHNIVITGDIEKMYRQIWIRPEDRKYQKVLWRNDNGEIVTYQLKTVTFGLAPAPYLATRCLQQLADDEKSKYTDAAELISRDMYVDDLLSGAATIHEARKLRQQVEKLLLCCGMNIRQWASNKTDVLEGLSPDKINRQFQFETDPILKTLGLYWQSQTDKIVYVLKKLPIEVTMRTVLSEIAQTFDPLGLLNPLIITGRLILQDCWRQHVKWDDTLPSNIASRWQSYVEEINTIENIAFKRAAIISEAIDVQLHGFADASELAYGACIYLRSITSTGDVQVHLLCSKAKVAPLKVVSLARLELCAALLLANLYEVVREHIKSSNVHFWSDSTITIQWIHTPPYQLKTFVANRVAEIQRKTSSSNWKHINSAHNPADAISRGQSASKFIKNELWTSGPDWLYLSKADWPTNKLNGLTQGDNEVKKFTCFTSCMRTEELNDEFISNFKTVSGLHRSIACCLRYSPHNKFSGQYSPAELTEAQNRILKLIQTIHFSKEVHALTHKHHVPENSKLKNLSPYIDDNGLIRVGGRLYYSSLNYDRKHPVVLPCSHPYTTLIIQDIHQKHFHAGPQSTLYAVRQRFWPINGRNEVKRVTHKCVRCIKSNPRLVRCPMGELPKERVTQSRPFFHTGVDYCGPLFVKEKKFRNRGKVKVYIAVFVCLASKAVHLEVVSDLTIEAFIAALRRFISRRGRCYSIHSDNGTNFVGANKELKDLFQHLNSHEHQQHVSNYLVDQGIEWKFIPARSPNFGGLWEAAVKSFKTHLIRMVGNCLLTYEELNTFVIEIEAILNSRPLTPSSTDPNDPAAITPGHFLIGEPITNLPDWNWTDIPANRLSSWQQIQRLKQAFWKRWSKEYLNGLNIRQRWLTGKHEIQEGTVVIIKDDNTRPHHWPLGRVIQTHPGPDGIIRAVSIKTPTGIITRNVRSLAVLLPMEGVGKGEEENHLPKT